MSYISQNPTTYLFVDGSNFRQYFNELTQKWFSQEVEFDFKIIKDRFQAEKAFYYDCVDDIKTSNETQQDFEKRVELQENKLNKIREVEGCHVQLGSLSGKGKKKRQKEVDVLLAVQMMEHALRGNMRKAVLLSGDKDFRPLVESLVRLGLFVEVAGDQKHISRDLIHAADNHIKLNFNDYYSWVIEEQKTIRVLNYSRVVFNIELHSASHKLLKEGTWNDFRVFVFQAAPKTFCLTSTHFNNYALTSNNCDELEFFFELLYGEINWK